MVIVSTSPEVAEDLGRIGLKKKIVNELFKKNCHAILVENIKNGQKINYFSSYKKFLKLFLKKKKKKPFKTSINKIQLQIIIIIISFSNIGSVD